LALFYEVDLEKRTVRNRSQYLLLIQLEFQRRSFGNVHHTVGRLEKLAGMNADNSSRHISAKSRNGSNAPLSIMPRNSGSVLFGKT